jgi:transposase
MTNGNFIRKLLGLVGLRVCDFWFKHRPKELHLHVKPHKNGARCPQCDRRGKIVRPLPQPRLWRDVPVCGWAVIFHYFPREILCPTHGRTQELIPWAEA